MFNYITRKRRLREIKAYRAWRADYARGTKLLSSLEESYQGAHGSERLEFLSIRCRIDMALARMRWEKPTKPAPRNQHAKKKEAPGQTSGEKAAV